MSIWEKSLWWVYFAKRTKARLSFQWRHCNWSLSIVSLSLAVPEVWALLMRCLQLKACPIWYPITFWEWVKLSAWTRRRRQSINIPVTRNPAITMVTVISTFPWVISTSSSWNWIRHLNPFGSAKVPRASALLQVQYDHKATLHESFLLFLHYSNCHC